MCAGAEGNQVHVTDDTYGLFQVMSLLVLCMSSRILLYRSIECSLTVGETKQPFYLLAACYCLLLCKL